MGNNDFDFDALTASTPETTNTAWPEPVVEPAANYGTGLDELEASLNRVDEVDPDAVITDVAPPPPAGTYLMKLKHSDGAAKEKPKAVKGFDHENVTFFVYPEGQTQLTLYLDYQLLDGDGNEIGRSKRAFPNTMIGRNVKTSEIDSLLKGLKIPALGQSVRRKVETLSKAIDGGKDMVRVEVDWELVESDGHEVEGKAKKQYDTFLRGMTRFPSVTLGGKTYYKPLEADPATGVPARCQWFVKKYLS